MENVHSAAQNVDATTQQLQETIAKALAPDTQGRDAGDNIRETLSNANEATGNVAEDTEALKHEFLFRGFFKRRGYYSMAHLAPDEYRQDKVFANPRNLRVWIEAAELFEPRQGEGEMLSRAGKVRIDAAVAQLGDRVIGGAMWLRVTPFPEHQATSWHCPSAVRFSCATTCIPVSTWIARASGRCRCAECLRPPRIRTAGMEFVSCCCRKRLSRGSVTLTGSGGTASVELSGLFSSTSSGLFGSMS